jgi:hypothetical protein
MNQSTAFSCGYAMNNLIVPDKDYSEEPRYMRLSVAMTNVLSGL